jgi:hypothetical protein
MRTRPRANEAKIMTQGHDIIGFHGDFAVKEKQDEICMRMIEALGDPLSPSAWSFSENETQPSNRNIAKDL